MNERKHPDREAAEATSSKEAAIDGAATDDAAADRAAATHLSSSQLRMHAVRLRSGGSDVGLAAEETVKVAETGLAGGSAAIPHADEMAARGFSLEGVAAHTDGAAARASQALGAEAFTYGTHMAFRSATPSPATVAHELRHVEQQTSRGAGAVADDEREAHQAETPADRSGPKVVTPAHHATTTAAALRLKGALPSDLAPSEVAGNPGEDVLPADKVPGAIKFNQAKWKGTQRAEILSYLRGAAVGEGGEFGEADVKKAARIQKHAGGTDQDIDGKIGDTSMAIFLHAGLQITAPQTVKASQVQLVFYPGEFEDIDKWKAAQDEAFQAKGSTAGYNEFRETSHRAPEGVGKIYVKVSGNLIAKMDCRGGPAIKLKDGSHSADPSRAGTYDLGKGQPYRTDSWLYSQIRWGAEIREQAGEIQFKDPGAKEWRYATGPNCDLRDPIPKDAFKAGGTLVSTWKKNDFGAFAWRIEGSPGMFVHTSPSDEETTELGGDPILAHSHGCLHVKPAERDEMMKAGYLQQGVKLTIKHYEHHLLPAAMRSKMLAAS